MGQTVFIECWLPGMCLCTHTYSLVPYYVQCCLLLVRCAGTFSTGTKLSSWRKISRPWKSRWYPGTLLRTWSWGRYQYMLFFCQLRFLNKFGDLYTPNLVIVRVQLFGHGLLLRHCRIYQCIRSSQSIGFNLVLSRNQPEFGYEIRQDAGVYLQVMQYWV